MILSVSCKKERFPVDKCFSEDSPAIPRYHIYHNKCKPLVIGHRGHPKLFQENTMDGLRSALESGADGFEVDVFLTKDNQIVCFHDQNAKVKVYLINIDLCTHLFACPIILFLYL